MRITHPDLAQGGLQHGFFTRRGGVSTGVFDSLNCGLRNADAPEAVRENRARTMATLGLPADALSTLWQVHGNQVIHLTASVPTDQRPQADALVTATPGVALGVLSADCAPLLFYDPQARVIGAAHSGWKGTLLNIGVSTLEAMETLGARRQDTIAVIGPCITADSYEVGPDFPAPFMAADPALRRFFIPAAKAGHFMFDLPGCIITRLQQAGIGYIAATGHDTCTESADFFSNRRTCHQGQSGFGLQLSAICLT